MEKMDDNKQVKLFLAFALALAPLVRDENRGVAWLSIFGMAWFVYLLIGGNGEK